MKAEEPSFQFALTYLSHEPYPPQKLSQGIPGKWLQTLRYCNALVSNICLIRSLGRKSQRE
jgi:hypothetical protein